MRKVFMILALVILSVQVEAQVRNAKSNARSSKGSSSSGSSGSSDSYSYSSGSGNLGANLMGFMLDVSFGVIWQAHLVQMERNETETWRTGVEIDMKYGQDVDRATTLLNPSIRANYGLFSTQVRWTRIADQTGKLTTFDWQMIQMNLINRKHFRWVMGAGISHEIELDQTNGEWLGEMTGFFAKGLIVPSVYYRSAGYPREEVGGYIGFNPIADAKLQPTLKIGFTRQNWYGEVFEFFTIGVGISIE